MANKNRKNQDQGSVKNTELKQTNQQKDTVNQKESAAGVQLTDTNTSNKNNHLNSEGQTQTAKTKDGGFQAGRFWELISRYKRYLAAGVLFAAMVVVLAKCTGPVPEETKEPVVNEQDDKTADLSEEFEIDAIPEVNRLVSDYYTAHASGDVDALEALAKPISDTEKSFIKLNSEYVEAYNNISCYTKAGLKEGEYIVSVYVDIKYKDVDTQAPGLDRFYLRTDESGVLYIDNAYSQFNQSNMEVSTEADVQSLLNEFEQAEDYLLLWANVEKKFQDALASDPELEQMARETLPNALEAWAKSLVQPDANGGDSTDKPADDQTEEPKDSEEDDKPDDNEDDSRKPEDDAKEDGDDSADGKAKTAYAMDGINMRKGPSTDDDIVTQIVLGSELKIYPDTEKDGWVKASFNGKKGYVKREFVTTKKDKVPSSAEVEQNKPAKALPEGAEITLTDTVNVRVSMSETAEKVGVAAPGDVVKVIMSYAEGWTKVEWSGQTGYMKTDLIQ